MPNITMRQMLEAGVHFGHQTRYWNPKMAPYIFGERGKIHIVNLEKTMPLFRDAMNYISSLVANGGTILRVQEPVLEKRVDCRVVGAGSDRLRHRAPVDQQIRLDGPDTSQDLEPVHPRHAQVEKGDVGALAVAERLRLGGVPCLSHDLDVFGYRKHLREQLPHQSGVVDDENSNGVVSLHWWTSVRI